MRELGRGGMGVVLEVRDPALPDRRLALKRLLPESAADPDLLRRFRREAEALARLRHPGVVAVHAYVEAGPPGPYLVTDLIDGVELRRHVQEVGPPGPTRAAALVRDLADALAAAHAAGVLHRDLKPANVLVRPDGSPVVIDFGLSLPRGASRLTATGAIAGTPGFLAPEQAGLDAPQDARVDVYGLGAILYWLLTGRPPFEGPVVQLLYALLHATPPAPSTLDPTVPPGLEAIALRALARDPARRHPGAAALRDDLGAWLSATVAAAPLAAAPRRGPALLGLLGVGAAALALAAGRSGDTRPPEVAGPAPAAAPTAVAAPPAGLPREPRDAEATARRRVWRARRVLRGAAGGRGATACFLPGGALAVAGEGGAELHRPGTGAEAELAPLEALAVRGGCVAVAPQGDGVLLLGPDAVHERVGPGRAELAWPRATDPSLDRALPGSGPLVHVVGCGPGLLVVAREGQGPAAVRRDASGAAVVTPLPIEGRLRALAVTDDLLVTVSARDDHGVEVSGGLAPFRLPALAQLLGCATTHAPTCLAAAWSDDRLVLGTADGRLNLLSSSGGGWRSNATPPLPGAQRLRGVAYGDGQVFALGERTVWRVPLDALGADAIAVHCDLTQDVALRDAPASLSLSPDEAVLAVCSESGDVVLLGTRAKR